MSNVVLAKLADRSIMDHVEHLERPDTGLRVLTTQSCFH
jgi:hypothetical protein